MFSVMQINIYITVAFFKATNTTKLTNRKKWHIPHFTYRLPPIAISYCNENPLSIKIVSVWRIEIFRLHHLVSNDTMILVSYNKSLLTQLLTQMLGSGSRTTNYRYSTVNN